MRQFLRALNPLAALRRQVSRWMQARLPLSDTLLQTPEPQFLGQGAALTVQLAKERRSPRRAVALAVHGSGHWAWTDVPAQGNAQVQIAFSPVQRGLHPVPLLTAETRYPLGTFRVWALWRPAAQVLVYPRPEPGAPPLPPGEPRSGGTGSAPSHGRP